MATPSELVLRPVPADHPDVRALTREVQAYYVQIYGGPDETPWTAPDFAPPRGGFVVGYADDVPLAMGGWRFRAPTAFAQRPAELKRMYVAPAARRQGRAAQVLARLEQDATASGADWVVLETGRPQVEAIAFYAAHGYGPVEPFGHYRSEAGSVDLGKRVG